MIVERRKFSRKKFRATGYVKRDRRESEFHITDLCVDGFRAYFNGDPLLEAGSMVYIRVPALGLEGFSTLIRIEGVGKGRYEAGFHFDAAAMHALNSAS